MKKIKDISRILATTLLITILIILIPATLPAYASSETELTPVSASQSQASLLQYEWHAPLAGNGERTAYTEGPTPGRPNVLWRSDVACPEIGEPYGGYTVAFDGKVFTRSKWGPNAIDALNCLDAFTGECYWTALETELTQSTGGFSTGFFSSQAPFMIDEDHVAVFTSGPNGMACFDANNGDFLWEAPIDPGAAYHRLVIAEDLKLLFGPWRPEGDQHDSLSAWDISNPDQPFPEVWRYPMDVAGDPMLCYGDGKVFMGSYSGFAVYAIDATEGTLLWETPTHDYKGYAGVYYDGKLITGCAGMYLDAYDAETGQHLWTGEETGAIYRGFMVWNGAAADGRTYWHNLGAGTDGFIGCWDTNNGDLLWKVRDDHYIGYHQIVLGDGKVFVEQSDGSTTTGRTPLPQQFACFDAYTGDKLWSIEGVSFGQPALAYGNLYVVDGNGNPDVYYCFSTTNAADWSMWRGNVEDPGMSVCSGPVDLSKGPVWTYETGAAITSSPVIADDKLVVGSQDGNVYCLDPYAGTLNWKFDIGTRVFSTQAIADGKVIVGPDDGNIYCLDLDDGSELWSYNAGGYVRYLYGLGQWQPRSSPIVYNGKIYVGALDGVFRCLDMSGNLVWSYDTGSPICGSAAIEDGMVYILNDANEIYKFTTSGTLSKTFAIANSILRPTARFTFSLPGASTPVVVDDVLYPGCTTAFFTGYDVNTGEQLFAAEQPNILGENAPVSPIVVEDPKIEGARIYCPAGPTEACGSAVDGTNIWTAWGGWEIFSSLAYGGYGMTPYVYGGSQSYSITCWDAETGRPVSWYTTGGQVESSPAIYNGRLYVGSADWKLYCFDDYGTQSAAATTDNAEVDATTQIVDTTTDAVTTSTIAIEQVYVIVAVLAVVVVAATVFVYLKRKR
ncbi:MAG: PQQ-binding-like beta-propeller repeat protein, partial [Candidatus Bathyarchaeota archaeon]|nr:PQQ-binding-like beta-propeller repeat protein [Candidatus Bathyarchaeota archaeon]